MTITQNDKLDGCQTFQANRTTRMELVGRDTDFRAQTILKAIGKPCRGIDHDRAGIHLPDETHCVRMIVGDDTVGVLRAVGVDVIDRRIDITIQSIEIVLIVVLAVVVGFIVFALLAPLLTLMDRLS